MIEVIGWLGFVGLIIGYILNAKKSIICFYVWGLGNILMTIYAVLINSNPQVATGAAATGSLRAPKSGA